MGKNWNDENVWNAISAIHRIAMEDSRSLSVDETLVKLRLELLEQPDLGNDQSIVTAKRLKAVVHRLSGSTPRLETFVAWLGKTGRFSEKELRRIRRVGLFREEETGQIAINKNMLSLGKATIILCLLFLIAGIWIGWVIFGSRGDFQGIVNSFALGIIIGAIASIVLDKSFRFKQIKTKIELVAPWLADPTG